MRISGSVLVCVAVLASCSQEEGPEVSRPAVEVVRGDLVYSASLYGELSAKKSQAIHVPQLTGVDYLTVDTVSSDGTMVEKDEVVLTFVKGPLEDNLRSAQTDLEVALAERQRTVHDLEQERVRLELDVKRKKMAVERAELFVVEGVNLISKLELEKYKLDVRKAKVEHALAARSVRSFTQKRATSLEIKKLKVDSAQRKVDEVTENLNHMEVKSPGEGMLYAPYTRLNWVRTKVSPGSVCRPGDKLLEIPDLSRYEATLYVRQRDSTLMVEGTRAKVFAMAVPGEAIDATMTRKESIATTRNERLGTDLPENNLKEIKVLFELESAPVELRPGGTVKAEVDLVLVKSALLVPLAALDEVDGQSFVELADGERRDVTLGKSSTAHAEVLGGLEEGDEVLLLAN